MKGPTPKAPGLLQRRNKTSTRSTLPTPADAAANAVVPELPKISETENWHSLVVKWWRTVWESPMASEYLASDAEDLIALARLHQDFWTATTATARQSVAAEIRQQSVRFGLSPIDRRRLQWEIEKGEQAEERTKRRRAPKADPKKDPREVLKAI